MDEPFETIAADLQAPIERDPAARGRLDVLLSYPGFHALLAHRLNHALYRAGVPILPRFLANIARFLTGIEIHPAAEIGKGVFIDHGMGVVIGETATVGNDVTLYQGVTLGGTGKTGGKRHPTLLDNVFVGNNANILGNITIGENSRVGAGSVVLRDVPPDSTVVGVPAHIVYQAGKRVLITDPRDINDPLSDVIIALGDQIRSLQSRLERLDGELHQPHPSEPASGLVTEQEERAQYRTEQLIRSDFVTNGEGI